MATNMYGTYDPYSADNLSGYGNATPEVSGLMSQIPVGQPFLPQVGGDGNADMTMSQSKGPVLFGGDHELRRALAPIAGVGQNALKSAVMGGNPLDAIKGSPLAVAKGMTDAGGFAPQDTQSKMISMLAKGGLGLMGGPASMMLSPLVDVGVSFGMDGLDARDDEAVRDDVEDSALGEAGGRRAWADVKDQMKGVNTDWSKDAQTVNEMLNDYARNTQMVQGIPFTDDAAQQNKMAVSALTELANAMNAEQTGFGGAGSQSDWNNYGWGQNTNGAVSYMPSNERASSYNSGGNGGGSYNSGAGGQTGGDKDGGRY